MKRRSFLKGLLFSAMMPIAMAFGGSKVERVKFPKPDYEFLGATDWNHVSLTVEYGKSKYYLNGVEVDEPYFKLPFSIVGDGSGSGW